MLCERLRRGAAAGPVAVAGGAVALPSNLFSLFSDDAREGDDDDDELAWLILSVS